ncbi:hypothetical protein ACO0QE_000888 [Hanseniaspora vineae]
MSKIGHLEHIFKEAPKAVAEFPLETQLTCGITSFIMAVLLFASVYQISSNKTSSTAVQFAKFLPVALLASAMCGLAIVFISNSVSVYL